MDGEIDCTKIENEIIAVSSMAEAQRDGVIELTEEGYILWLDPGESFVIDMPDGSSVVYENISSAISTFDTSRNYQYKKTYRHPSYSDVWAEITVYSTVRFYSPRMAELTSCSQRCTQKAPIVTVMNMRAAKMVATAGNNSPVIAKYTGTIKASNPGSGTTLTAQDYDMRMKVYPDSTSGLEVIQ